MIYEIRLRGHLSPQRIECFEGFTITPGEDNITILTGRVADQAALHGLFKKIRDSGISLLSVIPVLEDIDDSSCSENSCIDNVF